jgi:hypothetical protein
MNTNIEHLNRSSFETRSKRVLTVLDVTSALLHTSGCFVLSYPKYDMFFLIDISN